MLLPCNHPQNDHKQGISSQPITYTLSKDSHVGKLLIWHIEHGHEVLAYVHGPHTRLFLDENGDSFDRDQGTAFQNYWSRVFSRVNKLLKDQVGRAMHQRGMQHAQLSSC